jgi:hypothetical protein
VTPGLPIAIVFPLICHSQASPQELPATLARPVTAAEAAEAKEGDAASLPAIPAGHHTQVFAARVNKVCLATLDRLAIQRGPGDREYIEKAGITSGPFYRAQAAPRSHAPLIVGDHV